MSVTVGLVAGEGAGLVEDDGVDARWVRFRRALASVDEDAWEAGRRGRWHDYGGGGGEAEGAGAGDDEDGDGGKEGHVWRRESAGARNTRRRSKVARARGDVRWGVKMPAMRSARAGDGGFCPACVWRDEADDLLRGRCLALPTLVAVSGARWC